MRLMSNEQMHNGELAGYTAVPAEANMLLPHDTPSWRCMAEMATFHILQHCTDLDRQGTGAYIMPRRISASVAFLSDATRYLKLFSRSRHAWECLESQSCPMRSCCFMQKWRYVLRLHEAYLMADRLCTKAGLGQPAAQHGECLSAACLAICKDAGVVAG